MIVPTGWDEDDLFWTETYPVSITVEVTEPWIHSLVLGPDGAALEYAPPPPFGSIFGRALCAT